MQNIKFKEGVTDYSVRETVSERCFRNNRKSIPDHAAGVTVRGPGEDVRKVRSEGVREVVGRHIC